MNVTTPDDLPGYMAAHELAAVCALATRVPPGETWLEVGSYAGKSLLAAGLGLHRSCRIVSVDNFAYNPDAEIRDMLRRTVRSLDKHLAGATFINGILSDVSEPAHAVFVDADHSYVAVKSDIHNAKRLATGFICGHDFHLPEVAQAVREEFAEFMVVVGTTIWVATEQ